MHRKPFGIVILIALALILSASAVVARSPGAPMSDRALDQVLTTVLRDAGFTGRIESTLEQRLGRRLDRRLANIGRLLWFDTLTGLNDDNSCAGCHSPTAGFGDTQSIAIGIDNNGIVGPNRAGPRNMRVHYELICVYSLEPVMPSSSCGRYQISSSVAVAPSAM